MERHGHVEQQRCAHANGEFSTQLASGDPTSSKKAFGATFFDGGAAVNEEDGVENGHEGGGLSRFGRSKCRGTERIGSNGLRIRIRIGLVVGRWLQPCRIALDDPQTLVAQEEIEASQRSKALASMP